MRRLTLPELRRHGAEPWTAGESALLGRLSAILTFQELRPALEGELRRARRYERPLAVLVAVPDVSRPGASDAAPGSLGMPGSGTSGNGRLHHEPAHAGMSGMAGMSGTTGAAPLASYGAQLRFLLLGSILCGTLRESDIVAYLAERHEFCAMLPECGGFAAAATIARLHRLYASRTGEGIRAGVAVFPDDGLTLDDLVTHARGALVRAATLPSIDSPASARIEP